MTPTNDTQTYHQHIERLQQMLNRTFGRSITSMADFEELAQKTKLSVQSLRRFYGKIDKDKKLSPTSLNLICRYVGMPDWRSFCESASPPPIHNLLIFS